MIKSIDQQLYDAIFVVAQQNQSGADVYSTLPDLSARYPFIVIGEVQIVPRQIKGLTLGKLFATVDVWGDAYDRRKVSDISEELMELLSDHLKLETRYVKLVVSNSTKRILEDTTLSTADLRKTLWHGILSLEFDILI